jgi:hypothetical protein
VTFRDGTVFNFISFMRGTFPNLPVIAVKPAIDGPLVEAAISKAFEIATKSVGAWDYIDFNARPETVRDSADSSSARGSSPC